jgi:S-adenosylmethionine decarboxylase
MPYLARHILIELYDCPFDCLNDAALLERMLLGMADLIHTDAKAKVSHQFEPQGVTSVLIVGASHFCVHTWPEHGYASMDMMVCTDSYQFKMRDVLTYLEGALSVGSYNFTEVQRGLISE